ncbi:hypothetical protein ANCCEY_01681 [Ancylostoma ceylanicum]|uniref:Amine oxidase domain-containing protein n=1 Tax=Ancylostoma ceylanicum TaxID=53326 RepID=A0A0D6M6X8_9BILA|nr:hypothetical protein ANCCEY_01681 [Ancylostoma ceylanicum]
MPALPTRVAIIGAGFAGLSAAATLEKHSVDYVVYEGAGRVGGRVYSIPYGLFMCLESMANDAIGANLAGSESKRAITL